MKALIIGGTGTISEAITQLLIERGWDVGVLNRGSRSAPKGARHFLADVTDAAAVKEAVKGETFDVVAEFLAYVPRVVERDYELFSGKTGQYIFISSASAYQKPPSSPIITESTPLANPFWQYSRDKIACEEALMRKYREYGFPVTIVRPSHTYGKRNIPLAIHGKKGSWPVARRILAGKPVIIHGDGLSLWTFTHNTDFARAFVGLMANPHAIGEAVQITSDESVTWNQAHEALAASLGVKLNAVYASSRLIIEAGRLAGFDFEGDLLGDKSYSVIFDNAKLKRLVPGFAATTRFDQGVRESVDYILAHPELQAEDAEFDDFCDRFALASKSVSLLIGESFRGVAEKK